LLRLRRGRGQIREEEEGDSRQKAKHDCERLGLAAARGQTSATEERHCGKHQIFEEIEHVTY
jgi:hypothetical protein